MTEADNTKLTSTQPMKIVTIMRTHHRDDGTFGTLDIEGQPLCQTCELVWKDNRPDVSRIPAGEYVCKRVDSPHFGNVFQLQGVPNRSDVLIHKGNTIRDIKGCILVGSYFDTILGLTAVADSGAAFTKFMCSFTGTDQFKLVIKDL